jgi:hypothetical protein
MAKYRPILCGFWDDPDIEPFEPEEKLVYLFLFSNRLTTESGVYSISPKFISERTSLSIIKINNILNTLTDKYKKITRDGNIIFVHGFLHRNYKGRPEFLEKSIMNDMENHPSILIWTKFLEINKNHCISSKIKENLNTCRSVANTSYEYEIDNSTDNSIDPKDRLKKGNSLPTVTNSGNGSASASASASASENSSFEIFWKSYPKKVGKGDAFKAWKKLSSPVETLQLILIALEWQKQTDQWRKDNGQYIPNPSKYLNQQRWLDEKTNSSPSSPPLNPGKYFEQLENGAPQ